MTHLAARHELNAYLGVLAGEAPGSSFLELRYRVAEQTLASQFLPAHDRDAIAAVIASRASETDVYVGCAPRCRRSGTRNDIEEVWVLWAECDGAAAAHAARAYRPEPPVVIASGSGPNVHAYWPLQAPHRPQEAELANRRLALAVGADPVCFDAPRILRPPGTWNYKRRPPAPVTALRLDAGTSLDVRDVLGRAPEIDDVLVRRRWKDRESRDNQGDPLLELEPAVYVGQLLGVRARPGGKVQCPFHTDVHPSLHVYPTATRGRSCFSCGRGGSIYDLAAALWGTGTRGREFVALRRRLTERLSSELSRATPPVRSVHRRAID